ncbi:hypothetical protein TNCV_221121 [Trichonephila clavipes]|nr:hypothetical protein TNCV_221121 [Trichonephila clavipes]
MLAPLRRVITPTPYEGAPHSLRNDALRAFILLLSCLRLVEEGAASYPLPREESYFFSFDFLNDTEGRLCCHLVFNSWVITSETSYWGRKEGRLMFPLRVARRSVLKPTTFGSKAKPCMS